MDRGADPVRHRSAVSIVIGTRKSASARRSAYAKFSVYGSSPKRVSTPDSARSCKLRPRSLVNTGTLVCDAGICAFTIALKEELG
jgi:hypothetical protein